MPIDLTNRIDVERLNGTSTNENWYRAIAILPNGARAIGFGTTHANAIMDCMRDIYTIKKLQAK